MTVKEAKDLLKKTPASESKSKVNPSFTQNQFMGIIQEGLDSYSEKHGDDFTLPDIFEKRVYQATRNQRRPRY